MSKGKTQREDEMHWVREHRYPDSALVGSAKTSEITGASLSEEAVVVMAGVGAG
jgi:hypothetical protein